MANRQNGSPGRDTEGNPSGSGSGYTQVSSRLHGAAQDVSELVDLLTAGVVADDSTAAGSVAGSFADDDAFEPGDHPQGSGDRGDLR
jgi:hypothetical protein